MLETKITELKDRALNAKAKNTDQQLIDASFDTIEASLAASAGNKTLPGPTYPLNDESQRQTEHRQEDKKDNSDSDSGADGAPAEPEGGLGGTNLGLTPGRTAKEAESKIFGSKEAESRLNENDPQKTKEKMAQQNETEEERRQINSVLNMAEMADLSKKKGDWGLGE